MSEEKIKSYVPSQIDRKRAVLMYLLIGLLFYLSWKNKLNNDYLLYHFYIAFWLWIVFMIVFPIIITFMFLPFFRWFVSFLLILIELWLWAYLIKMAWDWKYYNVDSLSKNTFLNFFYKLGVWAYWLFEE